MVSKSIKNLIIFPAITAIAVIMSFSGQENPSKVIIKGNGWKFKTGDDKAWAKPGFDDSSWQKIETGKPWEKQGHANYDGYAWYRVKVFIPSAILENSYLKDSLQVFLGKIDDCDQFYLNGAFVGQNNKQSGIAGPDSVFINQHGYYDKDRIYTFSTRDPRILWDKENVLAVRVFDQGGDGGMFSGEPSLSIVDIDRYISLNKESNVFIFDKNNKVSKSYELRNNSKLEIKGSFSVVANDDENRETFYKSTVDIDLNPGGSFAFPVSFVAQPFSVAIHFTLRHNDSKLVFNFTDEVPYILTPRPGETPRINGAKITGVRPGNPFLYTVAATGLRPMIFKAENLPKTLSIDPKTGIIMGKGPGRGAYKVMLTAENKLGADHRELTILSGDQVALTPPLGWNSWNCWGLSVTDEKVIQSAHEFINKGLINHGWTYINIDDGWEKNRDAGGEIVPNEKFKNMKALGDSLHKLGLKFGIYSSPGPLTCGGYMASYQHELQDAKTYAKWGVDYLKYDWCSYGQKAKDNSTGELQKPYRVMHKALLATKRDIVFSLCQYGMGDVWKWGARAGGNLWRTTGDISDSWASLMETGFRQVNNSAYAGPGHWNDPDMMIVGYLGWGPELHNSRLSPNEQYTHVSLWALLSAPMLLGCDLSQLDDFTLNLLTNDEVLAIDQDPLGRQAVPLFTNDMYQVWVKMLEDGSKAIGIFNMSSVIQKVTVNLTQLGIRGKQTIRDVWRQKNLGEFENEFNTPVLSHGVVLLKITEKKR